MNLWTDDNASVMEAFMNNTTTTNSDLWPPPPPPPHQHFHQQLSSGSNTAQPFIQERLQQRLRSLIDGARESWTYAIYWQSSYDYSTSSTVLGWGDAYYKGDLTKPKSVVASSSALEQEHRRKVLRELNSLISDPADEAVFDEEVTDAEWFFLLSMTQSFLNGTGLAGQAFFSQAPAWVSGPDRLTGSDCERARQGNLLGFHTMVWIPSGSGVVELGSTDVVPLNPDLIRKVRIWFNFDGSDPGGPSSLWIYPTVVPSITACSVANANFSAAEESSKRKRRSPSTSVTDSSSSGMSTSVVGRSLASDDSEGLTPSAVFSQLMNPKGR